MRRSKRGSSVTPLERPPHVGICGAGVYDPDACRIAEEVGELLAQNGAIVVCGGLEGVMEAACKGAHSASGLTIGILPGLDRSEANDYVDVAIPTGMGEMRNALIVRASDVIIAISGEFGTLSEIAFALKTGVPVVGIDTWELVRRGEPSNAIVRATSAQDAVERALELAR
jgi:uncharacterized protein (TIGR00725 family)